MYRRGLIARAIFRRGDSMPRKPSAKITMSGTIHMKDNGGGNISLDFHEAGKPVIEYGKPLLMAWDVVKGKYKELENVSFDMFLRDAAKKYRLIFIDFVEEIGRIERTLDIRLGAAALGNPMDIEAVKKPNDIISHKIALGLAAGVKQIVTPCQDVQIEYIFTPRVSDSDKVKDPAIAFYDSCIESVACSIWAAYQKPVLMSLENVYAVFIGKDERAKNIGRATGQDKYMRLQESLHRMNLTEGEIITKIRGRVLRGTFPSRVPCELFAANTIISDTVSTEPARSVYFFAVPPLYRNAGNEIISVPKDIFDIVETETKYTKPKAGRDGKGAKATEGHALIKYYLLQRVYDITHGAKNALIAWTSMHERIKPKSRQLKGDNENFAFLVLENWKQKGIIADYESAGKGVRITPKLSDAIDKIKSSL